MTKNKKICKNRAKPITISRIAEIREKLKETYGLGKLNTNLLKIKPFKSTTESVRDIIGGCKSQDRQARDEATTLLYGIICEPIHGFILRYYYGNKYPHDCRDIAGDIALEIATKTIDDYKKDLGVKFRSWVLSIVKNKMHTLIKQKKWPPSTISSYAISWDDAESQQIDLKKTQELFQEHYEAFEKQKQESLVIIALDRLKHRDKAYIMCKYYHKRSCEDMSRDFNVSVGTVKSNLHRARKRLKTVLQNLAEELE